ncbi:MAG: DNA repair protein RecO [Patescibacteria group bacterium]
MDYKYTGIILNKKDVGETDRIYTIYTLESGKIMVLAKSVRKANAKLAGFLENFTLAEIFIAKSQGMGKITGSLVINNFPKMRENLEAVGSVFKSTELLNKLIKDENDDPKIFELLKEYLETMNNLDSQEDNFKLEIISLGFIFKLLEELGYKIEANNCLECGEKIKEGNNFFDPEQGGILCGKCYPNIRKGIKINSNSIKILRIFFQNSLKSLLKLKADKKDIDNLKIVKQEFLRWVE